MSQTYHTLYRTRLAKGKWRDKQRPVLTNNWEATYFDFDEEKILSIAKGSRELGVELFVLDDGWFGKRDDDTTSLGAWFVDERKFQNGIKGIANKISDICIVFVLSYIPILIYIFNILYV